jgi:hypothetical protein
MGERPTLRGLNPGESLRQQRRDLTRIVFRAGLEMNLAVLGQSGQVVGQIPQGRSDVTRRRQGSGRAHGSRDQCQRHRKEDPDEATTHDECSSRFRTADG